MQRGDNKIYRVDWSNMSYPTIRLMTGDELTDEPEKGLSITACREEIFNHFRLIILHARGEIHRAKYTPAYVIQEGKYR